MWSKLEIDWQVSYNAAGVLAHMASDGPRAWTVSEPARDMVLQRVAAAVERWDLRAERNINYRSFEPILSLLHAHHTPQCQHWAVWALANLTTVYREYFVKNYETPICFSSSSVVEVKYMQ